MQTEEKRSKQAVDLASLEPNTRVKQLANYGAMVDVDPNVPPRRWVHFKVMFQGAPRYLLTITFSNTIEKL